MKKNLKAENSSNDNYLTNVKETLCGFAARHIGLSADDINHMLDTLGYNCLLYTSPSPRDGLLSRMPSSA